MINRPLWKKGQFYLQHRCGALAAFHSGVRDYESRLA